MGRQTDRYESASDAYQNAMNKYTGEEGWKLALKQSKDYATTAGDIARSSGYKAARTAGYGKAASYALANDAVNDAVSSNLQTGVNAAINNNANTMSAQGANVTQRQGLDQMEYQQKRDAAGIGLQTAGQLISAFSDENLKTVYRDDNKKCPDLTIDWI